MKLLPKQSKSSKPIKLRNPENKSEVNNNYIQDRLVLLKKRQKRNVIPVSSPSGLTQTEEGKDVINTGTSKVQAILNDYYSLKLNRGIQSVNDIADIKFQEEESEVQVPSKIKDNSDKSETEEEISEEEEEEEEAEVEEKTSESSDVSSETSSSESEISARKT